MKTHTKIENSWQNWTMELINISRAFPENIYELTRPRELNWNNEFFFLFYAITIGNSQSHRKNFCKSLFFAPTVQSLCHSENFSTQWLLFQGNNSSRTPATSFLDLYFFFRSHLNTLELGWPYAPVCLR